MTKIKQDKKEKIIENEPKLNSKDYRIALEKKKSVNWIIKITLLALVLSSVFNLLTQISIDKASIFVAFVFLLFLVIINILGDGIAVSSTACELSPLLSMASRKEKGAKTAIWLVKNAEKVSSILADVVGDIAGILSGGFAVIIIIKMFEEGSRENFVANIIISAVIGATIISGKAVLKQYALKNPLRIVLQFSKLIEIFYKPK